jgi:hypothetical protein
MRLASPRATGDDRELKISVRRGTDRVNKLGPANVGHFDSPQIPEFLIV